MPNAQLVWLITGTSSGFGHDLAVAALKRGDRVIATARARSVSKLEDLKALGADFLELDVTSPIATLSEVAKKANDIHGRIDVLVNNAGYVLVGAIEENTPEETFEQFNTNVFGAINMARAVLPFMRARKTGTIIWYGSVGGWRDVPNAGLYAATKIALRSIGETLHTEISPLGLRSLVIEPGYFRTDFLTADNRAPPVSRIADYQPMTTAANTALHAYNGKQPGDPKKGVEVIIDLVKQEGVASGKTAPVFFPLGSDCHSVVTKTCQNTLRMLDEWKDVIVSTDYPK